MTKAELIADIGARGLRVVSVTQQPDAAKEAVGINSYIANVMEQRGPVAAARNIGFYVFDEGQGGEAAYYRDQLNTKNAAFDAMVSYLNGLVPGTYIRYANPTVDEDERYGFAEAWKQIDGTTATRVQLIIWKDGANPITHRELT